MNLKQGKNLFIALDIDGVLNKNNDFSILTTYLKSKTNQTGHRFVEVMKSEAKKIKLNSGKLKINETTLYFPFILDDEINKSAPIYYNFGNLVNYDTLVKFRDVVKRFLNKNKENLVYIVIVSSWSPYIPNNPIKNNDFFKSYLFGFDDCWNNVKVLGGKYTIGEAEKRKKGFLEVINKYVRNGDFIVYLDDIKTFINPNEINCEVDIMIPLITESIGLTEEHFYNIKKMIK